jgi:hypothetical protein
VIPWGYLERVPVDFDFPPVDLDREEVAFIDRAPTVDLLEEFDPDVWESERLDCDAFKPRALFTA